MSSKWIDGGISLPKSHFASIEIANKKALEPQMCLIIMCVWQREKELFVYHMW